MHASLLCLATLPVAQHALALKEPFDYIVVGAGTSGAVIANRLSEDPSIRVAVIEAGDDVRDDEVVRDIHSQEALGTYLDWNYTTVPQPGVNDLVLGEQAGRGWGGTTLINGMNYVRPRKEEVDAWEGLGNPGWNWDSLLPYYNKSEGFVPPSASQVSAGATYQPAYHGLEGPVRVGYDSQAGPASALELIQQGWQELLLQQSLDLNSGNNNGFGLGPRTLDPETDTRWHSSRAYLEPAEDRANFQIIKGTVKRLKWARKSPKPCRKGLVAHGVEYLAEDGQLKTLGATREVILSAGTFRSPGILEGSGVGNPRILESLGIEVEIDLAGVGENLSEQPCAVMGFAAALDAASSPLLAFSSASQSFRDDFSAWEASTLADIPGWAEATVREIGHDALNVTAIEKLLRAQHDLVFHKNASFGESVAVAVPGGFAGSFYMIQFAFSRGNVHLQSRNNISKPLIDPRFYTNDFDLSSMVALANLTRNMWYSESLVPFIFAQVIPEESVLPRDASVEQWREYLRETSVPNRHPLGTASMMSRELGGVVDPELRVYGTANVRVVDGSIIPMQISGHPIATLYAIAERAAEIIKAGQ